MLLNDEAQMRCAASASASPAEARRSLRNLSCGGTRRAARARLARGWCASPRLTRQAVLRLLALGARLRRCDARFRARRSSSPLPCSRLACSSRHEIEHAGVGVSSSGSSSFGFFPFIFALMIFIRFGAVVVGVRDRIERLGEILDELLGHLELLRANFVAAGKCVLVGFDELVGEAHDLEHQRIAKRL